MATKKSKTKKSDGLAIELVGAIYLHETTNGKTTKSELPGELMLELMVLQITQALRDYALVLDFDDIAESTKTRPRKRVR